MLSARFAASSWINLFLNQVKKSKYVAYLYVLETIQIPSQVIQKQQQQENKQTKDNTYTLRGYLMPSSKLSETLMSH